MLNFILLLSLWLIKCSKIPDIYYRLSSKFDIHVSVFRKFEKLTYKCKKLNLDLQYFEHCKTLDVCPKFLRFDFPKVDPLKSSESSIYDLILDTHIKYIKKKLKNCQFKLAQDSKYLKSSLSFLQFSVLQSCIIKHVSHKLKSIENTQQEKLKKLWLESRNTTPHCITNISSYKLSIIEEEALRYGLKHSIFPKKININKLKYEIEKSFSRHSQDTVISKTVKNEISLAINEFNRKSKTLLKNSKIRCLHRTLLSLSKNKNIKICPYDKGNGIVIIDSNSYVAKVNKLLNDTSKFKKLEIPTSTKKHPVCLDEGKLQRFLNKQVRDKIPVNIFRKIQPSGSQVAKLYGTVKVHKENFPVRPIVSTINSHTYELAKYLDSIIKPHISNRFLLKSTNEFIEKINENSHMISSNDVLVSFDVESLFTNVPVEEVINIATDLVYHKDSVNTPDFDKDVFKYLLNTATSGVFSFNEELYRQIDGVSMGSPLGPTLANLFLGHLEDTWTKTNFFPTMYYRYIDDCFCVFRSNDDIPKFQQFLNGLHPNIKFTVEIGNKNLSFLDVNINNDNNLTTTVFRKSTYTGLLMNYKSLCPMAWKTNLVTNMLNRAYSITSNWTNFSIECNKITEILSKNGYPIEVVTLYIRKFLNSKYFDKSNNKRADETRKESMKYVSIPYLGQDSLILRKILQKIYKRLDLDIRIVFNSFKTKNYFSLKDRVAKVMKSHVVYKFKCRNDSDTTYIGKTRRRLHQRIAEHIKNNTAISTHLYGCNHCSNDINNCFDIKHSGKNDFELSVVEAILINEENPSLNRTLGYNGKSYFLKIFD